MVRTEHDIRAALLTLVPDPATDASVIEAVHCKIARRRTVARTTVIAASAAAVGVGVAASLVLAISPSTGHLRHPQRTYVSAPFELRTLAKVAAVQPEFHPPGPGQYWYFETRSAGGSCVKPINPHEGFGFYQNCYIHVLSVVQTQTWIPADGSGRVRNTIISQRFASPRDRAHWLAAGRPHRNFFPADLRYREHELSIGSTGLGKLPTNPAKLAKVIDRRRYENGPPGPAEDFTQVADLLRFANASPALRAAAFKVGARIPGVKARDTVSFHGVTGAAIAFTSPASPHSVFPGSHGTYELIFDRATSMLKAEVRTVIKAGKILDINWVTYLTSGLVNSINSAPGQ